MIALRLARALAALHGATTQSQRGLLHGDLHPSNVLVSANGHVRLADLASVRPLPLVGPTEPAPPRFPAEPYAAPEALEGAAADERADVFALAALLVRLLAGHEPPIHRPASVRAFDVLADESPALRRLLVASLDRDPANRLPTAAAFAEALAAAMPAAASWTEADLVRSLRGSPRSEPVVGLRASTPPPPPPEPVDLGPAQEEPAPVEAPPVSMPERPSRAATRGEDATRPLRPDELDRASTRSAEDTARTLLDRALSKDPTPTPRPLPALTIDGVGDAPVPLFRFVAFFALAAFAALAAAAVWYFTRR